ncbi:integrase/recombinase XerC [Pedobacter cryoconitis]|uniref:Tyrosine recombinase XerC n=1 Tax=Pedobacter cryoconitis TaxID=188932 RepID=A0A7W8YQ15_9SPHI|nr:tyrosine-type recombinase/integrase [Pedobacter cryoconitis]MBB5619685.1 integrase/recombinase XerC [Pedobacter cryoconitis]MBB5647828.1 integrase/recombinase XerC [Pedobacter cryoconitis]
MSVESYLNYLQHEKRYSPHTVLAYRTDLVQFNEYIEQTYEMGPEEAKYVHIRDYIVHLMEDEVGANSIGRKLSSLRGFYKYLYRQKIILTSPMSLIKAPKTPERLPVFIEEQKLDHLLDSGEFFDATFSSVRDKMVIEVLFGTGMRLAELLGLKETDIDFYQESVKVLGKRKKERIIPVTKPLINQLKEYIELKSLQKFNNKTDDLFVTNKGTAVYPVFIYKIVKSYLTYISTQDKKSPHVLRHSYATSLLNRGADLNAIKELLGHASLAATQVYTHNSIERLKSIYKQAHPKA